MSSNFNKESIICSISTILLNPASELIKDIQNNLNNGIMPSINENILSKVLNNSDIISNIKAKLPGTYSKEKPIQLNLTLTNKNLYIEMIHLSQFETKIEVLYTEKISIENIKEFIVQNIGANEIILLTVAKPKIINLNKNKYEKLESLILLRKNQKADNLAQKMSTLINFQQ